MGEIKMTETEEPTPKGRRRIPKPLPLVGTLILLVLFLMYLMGRI